MPDQTSFIPKKAPQIKLPSRGGGLGWLTGFALIVFLLSLLLFFGLFFYRGYLNARVEALAEELKKVESEFEPSLVLELQRTSQAINSTKGLLEKHVALSELFDFLQANTLSDTRFSNFSYSDGSAQMSGVARTYAALARQALVFEQSRLIKDVNFSNFSLTSEGFVNFSLAFVPEPELITYSPR